MKAMFVTLDFDYIEKTEVERKLICKVKESKESVFLTFSTLCNYFEKDLIAGAKKQWPGKKININYKAKIYLGYYNFKAFKKVVFDKESTKNYQ